MSNFQSWHVHVQEQDRGKKTLVLDLCETLSSGWLQYPVASATLPKRAKPSGVIEDLTHGIAHVQEQDRGKKALVLDLDEKTL